jgi:hypothetical protein
MSYSRWSNSVWYTFYSSSSDKTKEGQVFEVCSLRSFTYRDLKDDMKSCIEDIRTLVTAAEWNTPATEKEYRELKVYMKEFIRDVDEEWSARGKILKRIDKLDAKSLLSCKKSLRDTFTDFEEAAKYLRNHKTPTVLGTILTRTSMKR